MIEHVHINLNDRTGSRNTYGQDQEKENERQHNYAFYSPSLST